jgi:hypothetical protein
MKKPSRRGARTERHDDMKNKKVGLISAMATGGRRSVIESFGSPLDATHENRGWGARMDKRGTSVAGDGGER